jgi:uncharacterized membrane protein
MISGQSRKSRFVIMSLLLTFFAMGLFAARAIHTNDLYYGFLIWNLFLAWIPFIFSWIAYKSYFRNGMSIPVYVAAFLWLIFFPNAPYIITDLIHIEARTGIPLWYDAALVFSFALTGFILGLASLYLIHRVIENRFAAGISWLLMFFFIGLSGYGIFIGRILRWNTWDIFINTIPLALELKETFLSGTSLSMSIIFSALTGIVYFFLFYFVRTEKR